MADMTYTEDQVRALREALTSGVLTVSYDGKSVTYRSVDEIKTALTKIENARARDAGPPRPGARSAGRCARSASSPTRGFEHAFLRPPKQSSRRRGLARTHRRVLARAPHRRRSIPQAAIHEAAGSGRRAAAWRPGNPGALATTFTTGHDLRVKSHDLVRRNAWAGNAPLRPGWRN